MWLEYLFPPFLLFFVRECMYVGKAVMARQLVKAKLDSKYHCPNASGVELSGVEWSRVESSGVEWSRVESSGVEWSRACAFETNDDRYWVCRTRISTHEDHKIIQRPPGVLGTANLQ